MVKEIGDNKELKTLIASEKLVVVDFYAEWCGPCKIIAPKFVELSEQFTDAEFRKVNIETVPEAAQEHGIQAMPTFKFFKNGEVIGTVVGANMNKVKEFIQANL